MRNKRTVNRDGFTLILVAVMHIACGNITTKPSKRTSRDSFRAIPRVDIASIVSDLSVAIIEETLGILRAAAAHVVVRHHERLSV